MKKTKINRLVEDISKEIEIVEKRNIALYNAALDIDDDALSAKTQSEAFKALRKMKGLKSAVGNFKSELERSGVLNPDVCIGNEQDLIEAEISSKTEESDSSVPDKDESEEEEEEDRSVAPAPLCEESCGESCEEVGSGSESDNADAEVPEIAVEVCGNEGGAPSDLDTFSSFDELVEELDMRLKAESEAASSAPVQLALEQPSETAEIVHEGNSEAIAAVVEESGENNTPSGFTMFGRYIEVESWEDMLIRVCEMLVLKNPYTVAQFDRYAELNPADDRHFSYNEDEIAGKSRKISNGLWVDVSRTSDETIVLCKKILELCGYPRSELAISYN